MTTSASTVNAPNANANANANANTNTNTNATTTKKRVRDPGDEPPYGRYAFLNPYNLSLFVGLVVTGLLSGHHYLVVIACGAELLWMIFAPSSKILRHLWFDKAFARAERAYAEDCRKHKIAELGVNDHERLDRLADQQWFIARLAKENPSLTVELLHDELAKLDGLVEDFIDLGLTACRSERHASTFDFAAMRRSWHIYESAAKQHAIGDPRRAVAEKNLSVLRQRRARYDDICRSIQVSRGQMELIEQTFRLLADEIMTMASPRELGGRIDELRVAVDAVRECADEGFEWDNIEVVESTGVVVESGDEELEATHKRQASS